jgi:hypothetical protein
MMFYKVMGQKILGSLFCAFAFQAQAGVGHRRTSDQLFLCKAA